MKQVIIILILSVFCAITVNGFLFKDKFKDGCDPNPCKNKGVCKKDARNPNISTCACTENFHGKICDLKTGCSKKPCRKGVCTNDKINPSNYTCKCNNGFVGKNCDTADACLKNPCKNNGKCTLDAKFKPLCSCKLGFGDKNCDKRNCSIIQYKGKHFSKLSAKVYVDGKIEKKMDDLDGLAKLCKVHILAIKSFILSADPKIPNVLDMKDKTNPNHYIGQAVSLHIHDEDDKLACNDICLGKVPVPHQGARCFVDGLHAINWKWNILDPTVVSTNYHIGNTNSYNIFRETCQVGCRGKNF